MAKRIAVLSVLLVVFVFIGASSAMAAVSESRNCTVTATVPQAISLTVNGPVAFGSVPVGVQTTQVLGITVRCNDAGWDLNVRKASDLDSGADTIPSSRLVYTSTTTNGSGVGADTEFGTLGFESVVVNGATTSTGQAGASVNVTYKLTANFDDDQGDYTAVHTYIAAKA